jgi:hypothetical protein
MIFSELGIRKKTGSLPSIFCNRGALLHFAKRLLLGGNILAITGITAVALLLENTKGQWPHRTHPYEITRLLAQRLLQM